MRTEPTLEQFGLTAKSYEDAQAEDKPARRIRNVFGIVLFLTVLLWIPQKYLRLCYSNSGVLGVFFGLCFLSIPATIAAAIFKWILKAAGWFWLRLFLPDRIRLFERCKEFDTAKAEYAVWRAESEARQLRAKIEFWETLTGKQFEVELARVYRQLGYEAMLTPASGDGGVDIFLKKDGETIIVQCKAHQKPIGEPVARDLFGTLQHLRAHRAILAATGRFTSKARGFVRGKPIELISITEIIQMQNMMGPAGTINLGLVEGERRLL